MEYREIGRTGEKAGVVGLGCEHLDKKPYEQAEETIHAALEYGVNLMDVFMPGREVRENIAKALGSRRRDVMIQGHIGSTDINQQYDISRDMPTVRKYFEDLLRIFGGYIDFGMMFYIDSEKDYKNVFETEFATYVLRLKQNGDIRHIGFSSHNPVTAIKAIGTGLPEMLMFSVNPAFDMLPPDQYVLDHLDKEFGADMMHGIDPKRAELYRICENKGIGVTTMKTFCAGKLLSAEQSPYAKSLTAAQCIHYALSRPAVASVLPGCKSAAEVEDVMKFLTAGEAEKDYSDVLNGVRNDFRGSCVYCSHCQPCLSGIDIAAVNRHLDIARLDPAYVNSAIRDSVSELFGRECVECGNCEERCPFGVPVIENIKEFRRLID